MPDQIDEGLKVLSEHLAGAKTPIPENLLQQCYQILRDNMYESDQEVALVMIRKLVEAEANRLVVAAEGASP